MKKTVLKVLGKILFIYLVFEAGVAFMAIMVDLGIFRKGDEFHGIKDYFNTIQQRVNSL